MNFIKLTTFILLLPLSSFSQSKNLEINDFFDFKITSTYNSNSVYYNLNSIDSTFTVPEGKLWKINYFGIGFRKNLNSSNNFIGQQYIVDYYLYLDGALIDQKYLGGSYPYNAERSYEKKCPIWLNSGEHKIIIQHPVNNTYNWEMKLNLSIVEFNITEN